MCILCFYPVFEFNCACYWIHFMEYSYVFSMHTFFEYLYSDVFNSIVNNCVYSGILLNTFGIFFMENINSSPVVTCTVHAFNCYNNFFICLKGLPWNPVTHPLNNAFIAMHCQKIKTLLETRCCSLWNVIWITYLKFIQIDCDWIWLKTTE